LKIFNSTFFHSRVFAKVRELSNGNLLTAGYILTLVFELKELLFKYSIMEVLWNTKAKSKKMINLFYRRKKKRIISTNSHDREEILCHANFLGNF